MRRNAHCVPASPIEWRIDCEPLENEFPRTVWPVSRSTEMGGQTIAYKIITAFGAYTGEQNWGDGGEGCVTLAGTDAPVRSQAGGDFRRVNNNTKTDFSISTSVAVAQKDRPLLRG